MSPLRWTCKSLRRLAGELKKLGRQISHTVVGELLKKQKFSLQAHRKTLEGADNPDRDAQFHFINDAVQMALAENQPVISVDTKKKELVGDFKNAGREWRPQGDPEDIRVHDFLIKELGRAVPYGIYDLAANAGWVNVGIDNDTAAFAVQTIRRWWQDVGRVRYPLAQRLPITAAGGGGNGSRVRLWKRELQKLADELAISIEVRHLPPGTSKWNKIEHRLFSFITQNWRAKPLVSYRVIVDLIAATTTETGWKVHCELDANSYPKGIVVSDDEMASLNIKRADFHGEWNYSIAPSNQSKKAVIASRTLRKDEGGALALFRTDRAEDVCRGRALIVRRRGSCAAFCPAARDFILLADVRLVGKPDFYGGWIDVLLARDFVQTDWEFFLNSSMAPSACAW
jgi:Rhodopirellula transposase DDE domain